MQSQYCFVVRVTYKSRVRTAFIEACILYNLDLKRCNENKKNSLFCESRTGKTKLLIKLVSIEYEIF